MGEPIPFKIPFDSLPHYLTVYGVATSTGIRIEVHSTIHKNKLWHMPTSFASDYWNDCFESAMATVLSAVVRHYDLKSVTRYE